MNICFNIQLTGDNTIDWATLPIDLDVDNETQPVIELDTPDLFKGTYTGELIYNVSFPKTEKNYRILGGMLSGASYQLERKDYSIFAVYNGEILNVDKMYPIRNGYLNDDRFEVQLFNSKNWVKLASDKKINTIEVFSNIPILQNSGNIDIFNSLGPKWEDSTIPVRYPFVTREIVKKGQGVVFGQAVDTLDYYWVVESDLTPYVSLLRVLQKGFSEIGWKFECPFLESDYGRRIWVDLCKDDFPTTMPRVPLLLENCFGFYGARLSFFSKYVLFRNVNDLSGPFKFEQSSTPTITNQWFNNGAFSEAIVADFNFSMTVKRVSPTRRVFEGEFDIVVETRSSVNSILFNHIARFPYYISGGEEVSVNIDLTEISINERDKLFIYLELRQKGVNSSDAHYVQCTDIRIAETKLHRRCLNKTSSYKVQELFYDDSLLDLLKGISHMIYGKIDLDTSKKIIRLLAPYTTVIGGETIEGYYKENTDELKNIQRVDYNAEDIDRKRYLHLSFQDSKEDIVKELYPDNEKQLAKYGLHGIFVDFGDKYDKEIESYKNPYFTPTYSPTKDTSFYNAIAGYETGTYINKGRRIVFALGGIDFQPIGEDVVKVKFWNKDGVRKNPFWAHQSFSEDFFEQPNAVFMHLGFSTMKQRPDYEDVFPNLYDVFVKKYMINLITSVSGTVWKYMSSAEFSLFTKRKQYYFNIKDRTTICSVIDMEGFRPCENQVVGINFIIGDNFRGDPITTSTPPENERPYAPELDFEIVVNKTDCSYFITLDFL